MCSSQHGTSWHPAQTFVKLLFFCNEWMIQINTFSTERKAEGFIFGTVFISYSDTRISHLSFNRGLVGWKKPSPKEEKQQPIQNFSSALFSEVPRNRELQIMISQMQLFVKLKIVGFKRAAGFCTTRFLCFELNFGVCMWISITSETVAWKHLLDSED